MQKRLVLKTAIIWRLNLSRTTLLKIQLNGSNSLKMAALLHFVFFFHLRVFFDDGDNAFLQTTLFSLFVKLV